MRSLSQRRLPLVASKQLLSPPLLTTSRRPSTSSGDTRWSGALFFSFHKTCVFVTSPLPPPRTAWIEASFCKSASHFCQSAVLPPRRRASLSRIPPLFEGSRKARSISSPSSTPSLFRSPRSNFFQNASGMPAPLSLRIALIDSRVILPVLLGSAAARHW